jgi:hypothetical protein
LIRLHSGIRPCRAFRYRSATISRTSVSLEPFLPAPFLHFGNVLPCVVPVCWRTVPENLVLLKLFPYCRPYYPGIVRVEHLDGQVKPRSPNGGLTGNAFWMASSGFRSATAFSRSSRNTSLSSSSMTARNRVAQAIHIAVKGFDIPPCNPVNSGDSETGTRWSHC